MSEGAATPPAMQVRRALFVATILVGSFLLFLVQPMIARMALPRLGGAPNVWNSAMLVYQALLLAGYGYAHLLGQMSLRRAATIHLTLLVIAATTLPIALAQLPPAAPGWEVLWVPALFAVTIGPVFFLVSAQAPLMQRWFALHPAAGEPWALYAASNLGSFAGLLAYPLLAEPLLSIAAQRMGWSIGYGLLILLIVLVVRARWHSVPVAAATPADTPREKVGARRILLWLALSAVTSGLMLSTTTHLTTDVFAMPLLWVIPLGLYLLSFSIAFSDRRRLAQLITMLAPVVLLLAGGTAMVSNSSGSMALALGGVVLLFVVAVTLHSRMYDLRPDASQLTLFYLVMSAGGALGGVFTALIAPVVFDWVWEHPVLILAAAMLMPFTPIYDWRRMGGLDPEMGRTAGLVLLVVAGFLAWLLFSVNWGAQSGLIKFALLIGIVVVAMLLAAWRFKFVAVLAMLMLAQGGVATIYKTFEGTRTRSYFGIYTVQDYPSSSMRSLAHGTTLHGQQPTDPPRACTPTTYYGRESGAALALVQAPALFGAQARIAVIGLGTGTLAAYHQRGEQWRFYEIDPAVVKLSRQGTFTYLDKCAPDAQVVIGDARLELAKVAPGSIDVLVVDAFSSDAIPLHLLTDEAIGVYLRALSPRGLLLVHISNRYFELEPVIAAAARRRGLTTLLRDDVPADRTLVTPSSWVVLSRDKAQVRALTAARPAAPWRPLLPAAPRAWTDDHASILPYVRWDKFFGNK